MPEPLLLLRLMAEVGTAAEAEAEMRRATSRLEPGAAVVEHAVERYWKIPAYWEITLHLRPQEPARAAFDRILALAASGWTQGDASDADRWAVWNAAPGVELLTPRVRWAELQLYRPAD